MKNILLLALAFLFCSLLQAQSPATAKGASLIDGTFRLSSDGVRGISGSDNRTTSAILGIGYQYFVVDRFAVGLNGAFSRSGNDFTITNSLLIGPEIAYYFDRGTPFTPYVSSNIRFGNSRIGIPDNRVGVMDGNLAVGMVFRKKHLAVLFELGYQGTRIGDDAQVDFLRDANQIYFSIGIAGFLFKE